MQRLRAEVESLRQQRTENQRLLKQLQTELDQTEHLPTAKVDLYKIRDRVLKNWKVAKRAESKQRLQEFADQLIEAVIAGDTSYMMNKRG